MTNTITTAKRTLVLAFAALAIMATTLVVAPEARAAGTAAGMGATCYDSGRLESTVNVFGGRNQTVATKFFVQKLKAGRWTTVYKTNYSQFKLTFTDPIDNSVGIGSKKYAVNIKKTGKYRVWTLVWFWNSSTRKWTNKTWVRPDLYSAYTNGRIITLSTQYCRYQ